MTREVCHKSSDETVFRTLVSPPCVKEKFRSKKQLCRKTALNESSKEPITFPVNTVRRATPVPIPNTAVKPPDAHGSRTQGPARAGHCRVSRPVFPKRNDGPSRVQGTPNGQRTGLRGLSSGAATFPEFGFQKIDRGRNPH